MVGMCKTALKIVDSEVRQWRVEEWNWKWRQLPVVFRIQGDIISKKIYTSWESIPFFFTPPTKSRWIRWCCSWNFSSWCSQSKSSVMTWLYIHMPVFDACSSPDRDGPHRLADGPSRIWSNDFAVSLTTMHDIYPWQETVRNRPIHKSMSDVTVVAMVSLPNSRTY